MTPLQYIKGKRQKMVKPTRKRTKGLVSARKSKKTTKDQRKAAEYLDCLLELHKLQGLLLAQLRKEV